MTATESPAESIKDRGLVNFRDLGGLPASAGAETRPGVLYRSAAVLSADETPSAGVTWPPSVVVDLRGGWTAESDLGVHPLAGLGTSTYPMPMLDGNPTAATPTQSGEHVLAAMYRRMVTTRAADLVGLIGHLGGVDGPALVHCAAGKDRTGVVVAVLLRACDVEPDAIVADYQLTLPHMPAILARHTAGLIAAPRPMPEVSTELRDTPEAAIRAVLDELDSHPDGAAGWLGAHGLDAGDLARWRQRLLR